MKHLLLISAIGDLNLISGFSISLPLALGLIKLKSLDKEYMLLFVLISVSFIVEIIAGILSANAINNLWLGNIFFLTESLLWGLIMRQWLESKKLRIFIYIFLAAYLVVWIYTTFFVLDFHRFNTYARTMESLAFVFLSCFLMITISTDTSQVIFQNPKFWFGSAVLIYFSVNLIVFGTVNYIASNQPLMDNTWMIHSFTNIFANLLLAIGFLCIRQKAI